VIRVLIVAAFTSVRAGLNALLAGAAPDCAVVGEVGGSRDLERVLPETRPDVVLFDTGAGGGGPTDGDELCRVLALLASPGGGEAAATGLVVLGENRADPATLAASTLPGWAYLLREADGPAIAAAVRAVAAGLAVLDRSLALPAATAAAPRPQIPGRAEPAADTPPDPPGEVLTPREMEVLQLMAHGLPNKRIAARLGISLHTAKFHVAQILAKLDAGSRTEAVTRGARRGYVTL
jgi:DNA-binding NarL/FixJ family response regulator